MSGDNSYKARWAVGDRGAVTSERGLESGPATRQDAAMRSKKREQRVSSIGSRNLRPLGRGGPWQPLPTKETQPKNWEPPIFGNPHHCLRQGDRQRMRSGRDYSKIGDRKGREPATLKDPPLQGGSLGVTERTQYLGPSWTRSFPPHNRKNEIPPSSSPPHDKRKM